MEIRQVQQQIFLPILAMAFLTFLVWLQMYFVRIGTAIREKIPAERIRPTNRDLPLAIVTSGDNWRNLFEAPVLFYVLCLGLFILGWVDQFYIGLAWAYCLLRLIHSIIHLSYNRILHRFGAYVASCFVLWAMWVRFGFQLIQGTG